MEELLQLLTPEGERLHDDEFDLEVSGEELRGLFRDMVLVRRVDQEAHALQPESCHFSVSARGLRWW